jgi:hypothetical protein
MKKVLIAATALAAICAPAHANIVVDQSNLATVPQGGQLVGSLVGQNFQIPGVGGSFYDVNLAQSVTAGLSGKLSSVDLQLAGIRPFDPASQYEVTLAKNVTFNLDGSVGGATVLGSFVLPIASLNSFPLGSIVNIDTSALNLNFNAGDQFWLALAGASNPSVLSWAFGTSATMPPTNPTLLNYAGGAAYAATVVSAPNATFKYNAIGKDFAFRTWVDTGAVPEPATWAMMIAGLAITGGAMRRRNRTAVSFA